MNAPKRGRGRPPKPPKPFFTDGRPAGPPRPLSELGKRLADAAVENKKDMRRRWGFGPHVGDELIESLEFGDLEPSLADPEADQKYREAKKKRRGYGAMGGTRTEDKVPGWRVWLNGEAAWIDEKLRDGRSRSSVWKQLRKNWTKLKGPGSPPSERSLYAWAKAQNLAGTLRTEK